MSDFYRLGIDVGSTTVKLVALDNDKNIIYSEYQRHFSDIKMTAYNLLHKACKSLPVSKVKASVTGSGGIILSKLLGLPFVQEVVAAKIGVNSLLPNADVAIELGGEDAKILFFTNGVDQRMNGTCAGGTGAFIDQMATLLKTNASGLGKLASKHKILYPIAARCGVFAKSDVQPLLNEGAAKEDIAASILQSVVTQTICGLAHGRSIKGNVVFLGGPLHFLPQLRRQFEQTLSEEGTNFIHPENAQLFVAIGAALSHVDEPVPLCTLADKMKDAPGIETEITRIRPLFLNDDELNEFYDRHSKNTVKSGDLDKATGELYLGLDVGSTTIKAALTDNDGKMLYSHYSLNEGNPVRCGVEILRELYSKMPDKAYIANACVTGYGEELIKSAFNIKEGEIETIAHYKAANLFCPGVDFIIDIGGQDMKCMKIKNGFIEDIMLNEACSSGCGSFIQTFAESLGMEPPQFAKEALTSKQPVDLGTRCTVFMNSRVKQAQKEGATIGDISAGLSYSVVRNALYKVIKLRNPDMMGDKVVVQGGTFKNDSILRCFELVSGKQVVRSDISGIMGAFGAALIARERYDGNACDIIKADELEAFDIDTNLSRCKLCSNRCQLTVSTFANGASFISGNKCDRGLENKKISVNHKMPNLYDYKYTRIFDYKPTHPDIAKRGLIGIPRVLNVYDNYPLWFTFFTELGFSVHISSRSSHNLYKKGMNTIPSESVCYPAKLAHGHVFDLVERGIKTIFYPCIPYEQKEYKEAGNHYNCPIVTSYAEVIYNNMDIVRGSDVTFLYPFLTLDDTSAFAAQMLKALKKFGVTKSEINRAAKAGFAELARFKNDVQKKGEEMVARLEANGEKGIVLAGRPYHIDPEINHGIPNMINSLGFAVLTEDSVAHLGNLRRPLRVVDQWTYHTRLYHAAEYVTKMPCLELIQLNSFGCGLDAVTTDQLHEILSSHNKIYTALKIDELTSLGTAKVRVRSLKAAVEERNKSKYVSEKRAPYEIERKIFTKEMKKTHTIIFPQMSPIHFGMLEAVFKANGYNAMLLEKATQEDIEAGLKYVNNDACYPSIIVTGQLVNAVLSGKCDPDNTSIFITQTGGGCRATNYIAFIRKALKDAGFPNIPVVSLNVSGFEGNPGFKFTPKFLIMSIKALILGDLLLTLSLRVRPYETEKGSTNAMVDKWDMLIRNMIVTNKINFNEITEQMIIDFESIEADEWALKPKVGIVGEILVKFHPDANNDVIGVIESEGAEAVMPGIIDFFMYCFYNSGFKSSILGKSKYAALVSNMAIAYIEKSRRFMKKALEKRPRFASYAPVRIANLAKAANKVLQLGNTTGEGWFLTAEMIELIHNGVNNIVCVQPFACLPNHVTGKGMIKELRRQYPKSNIIAVDYDPGASEVNQINRIKLMLSIAFENIEEELEAIRKRAEMGLMRF